MKYKIETEINRLVNILIKEQEPNGSWTYPFETGITTDCYMIILLRTLEINDEDFIQSLVDRIISKQDENGSWKLFYDEEEGNLTATVEAYYALLYSGYCTKTDSNMRLARNFIINNGGLKEINMFTKVMLALTGQYKWPEHFPIPVEIVLLPLSFPVNFFDFSVYARVNFIPIVIAADYKFSMQTKRTPDLSELFLQRGDDDWEKEINEWRSFLSTIHIGIKSLIGLPHELHRIALNHAEQYMLQRIESDGTFYSYFSSTFLMIFALMAHGYSKQHPIITKAIKGLKSNQTRIDDHLHIQYTKATVWNTALISYSLQEAGISSSSETIKKAQQYLISKQHYLYSDWAIHNQHALPGGWGFADINTMHPDIDDTTASLRAIRSLILSNPVYRQAWDRANHWIISMQNDDGGWAAFEKNVNKSFLSWLPVEGGTAMILDPSTADLTGRTLEYFGNFTRLNKNHPFIKRGIEWLLRNQEKDGSWYGRWGICYIYGTWAAITGLVAVNTRNDHPAIQKAIRWLYRIQNPNGGWGESCKSDIHKKYISLNESTRTHTAWALDTLISAENEETVEINRGITYLLESSHKNDWTTTYPKGQGLPNGFYMHYHSYEYLFPLLALSHYKNKFFK
ncbi:squalene--hopene cyclase [Metabacillus sediminilitoris]|uniref:Squalene--hopene cyclase n=2 Tax=Metabacillus sediminilitoris TaxID=2567941 RepID=A0A4S4BW78_9BACI|nr:squalene--hopene cyclase [Metabacillus sediminilitoris]THF79424.1 squalene--hopene cyclase [Metabacillus sediminilitoris]